MFVGCIHRLIGKARDFCRQESGMTLPLIAASFVTMIGLAGLSVDVAREQLVQSKLLFALDSAGLAAGTTLNTANIDTELTKYLRANFPDGYLGATAPIATAVVSSNNLVIDITGSTTIEPVFMQMFGAKTLTISAKTQITRATAGLELAIVLDNTYSMNDSLDYLRTAAKNLVNILYDGKESVSNLWIGLVPFTQTVNIGTSRTSWLDTTSTYNANLNWEPSHWYGCVDARYNGVGTDNAGPDTTDDPPSVKGFLKYYYPGTNSSYSNFWKSSSRQSRYEASNYSQWYLYNSYYYDPNVGSFPAEASQNGGGPNRYCPQPITPMTANKGTVLSAIDAMTVTGGTHINLGLVWGWRMLSPRWKSAWGLTDTYAEEQLPLNYKTSRMNKAVVLLTDGVNTAYNDSSDRTAYGRISEGRLGTTSRTDTAAINLNTRLSNICAAMKSKGIFIYTIALGASPDTTTKNLLKGCATGDSYYFYSPTASELQSVFSAIADSLSNLRISQ